MDQPPYDYPPARRPFAWTTWTIVVSTVAVFLLQLYEVKHRGYDVVGNELAFSPEAWDQHRYWTLLTYAWAHATSLFGSPGLFWLHIAANMLPLICLGPALEELLGHGRFLGLYLGGALAAALVWFGFNLEAGTDEAIIGASGAIFGLIAAAGTAAPRARIVVYLFFVIPLRMNLGILAVAACGLELAQAIFGWMPTVAHSAHLGGAAFGFLFIALLRWRAHRRMIADLKSRQIDVP